MTVHHFQPSHYYTAIGAAPPVLRIAPGDTVHTTCVDAHGLDAAGCEATMPGNPMTGPFYIEGAQPGETLVVPAGTPHVWWNGGDDELHVVGEVRPALRTETFFESFFGLAQDGKVHPKTGLPNILQMAVLLRAFRHEIVLAQPPTVMQTLLFGGLAPIGRALRYKAEYPYPFVRPAGEQVHAT